MLVKCLFLALLTRCLALQQQNCTQVGRKTKNLTIQLQVSQSLEHDLSGYIPFMEVALRLINTNSCVLPDYHISFTDIIDSRVSRHTSVSLLRHVCTYVPFCPIPIHVCKLVLDNMGGLFQLCLL